MGTHDFDYSAFGDILISGPGGDLPVAGGAADDPVLFGQPSSSQRRPSPLSYVSEPSRTGADPRSTFRRPDFEPILFGDIVIFDPARAAAPPHSKSNAAAGPAISPPPNTGDRDALAQIAGEIQQRREKGGFGEPMLPGNIPPGVQDRWSEQTQDRVRQKIEEYKKHKGLLEDGNIDLSRRELFNPDGTANLMRGKPLALADGRTVLLPMIGDQGQSLSDEEAAERYLKTGQHLGIFAFRESAEKHAQLLHDQQIAAFQQPFEPPTDPVLREQFEKDPEGYRSEIKSRLLPQNRRAGEEARRRIAQLHAENELEEKRNQARERGEPEPSYYIDVRDAFDLRRSPDEPLDYDRMLKTDTPLTPGTRRWMVERTIEEQARKYGLNRPVPNPADHTPPAPLKPDEERAKIGPWSSAWASFAQSAGRAPSDVIGAFNVLDQIIADNGGTRQQRETAALWKKGLQKYEQELEKTYKTNPDHEQRFLTGILPSAAGSLPLYMLTGQAGPFASLASSGLGALQGAYQQYSEAKQMGADEATARKAFLVGLPIGSLEGLFGIGKGKAGVPVREGMVKSILKAGGGEVVEEFPSQVAQNANAKWISGYDPKRSPFAGVLESSAAAFILGGGARTPGAIAERIARGPVPKPQVPRPYGTIEFSDPAPLTAEQAAQASTNSHYENKAGRIAGEIDLRAGQQLEQEAKRLAEAYGADRLLQMAQDRLARIQSHLASAEKPDPEESAALLEESAFLQQALDNNDAITLARRIYEARRNGSPLASPSGNAQTGAAKRESPRLPDSPQNRTSRTESDPTERASSGTFQTPSLETTGQSPAPSSDSILETEETDAAPVEPSSLKVSEASKTSPKGGRVPVASKPEGSNPPSKSATDSKQGESLQVEATVPQMLNGVSDFIENYDPEDVSSSKRRSKESGDSSFHVDLESRSPDQRHTAFEQLQDLYANGDIDGLASFLNVKVVDEPIEGTQSGTADAQQRGRASNPGKETHQDTGSPAQPKKPATVPQLIDEAAELLQNYDPQSPSNNQPFPRTNTRHGIVDPKRISGCRDYQKLQDLYDNGDIDGLAEFLGIEINGDDGRSPDEIQDFLKHNTKASLAASASAERQPFKAPEIIDGSSSDRQAAHQTFRTGSSINLDAPISLKQLKINLGKAGMKTNKYKIFEASPTEVEIAGGDKFGWTARDGAGNIIKAPDGRPLITLTPLALSSVREALTTIGHEIKHILDEHATELEAERFGLRFLQQYDNRMSLLNRKKK